MTGYGYYKINSINIATQYTTLKQCEKKPQLQPTIHHKMHEYTKFY